MEVRYQLRHTRPVQHHRATGRARGLVSSWERDSNPRPTPCERAALPTAPSQVGRIVNESAGRACTGCCHRVCALGGRRASSAPHRQCAGHHVNQAFPWYPTIERLPDSATGPSVWKTEMLTFNTTGALTLQTTRAYPGDRTRICTLARCCAAVAPHTRGVIDGCCPRTARVTIWRSTVELRPPSQP